MLYCCSGYKKEWFKERQGKTIEKYDYMNDLCIIEEICKTTGDPTEIFPFYPMFKEYLDQLERFFPDKGAIKALFHQKGKNDKEGLRAILFLMLQVVICSHLEKWDDALNQLWATLAKCLTDEPGKMGDNHIYHHLFHNLINLTVGFSDCEVSVVQRERQIY